MDGLVDRVVDLIVGRIQARGSAVGVSSEQKAAVALMAAAGRLRRQFGGVFDGGGVSASQYNVLRILRGADGALPIMTIRDRMLDREPSITRLIDRLEEKGLVCRTPCTEDRRRIDCTITAEGIELLADLDDVVDEANRRVMRGFKKSELKTMRELLDRAAPEA